MALTEYPATKGCLRTTSCCGVRSAPQSCSGPRAPPSRPEVSPPDGRRAPAPKHGPKCGPRGALEANPQPDGRGEENAHGAEGWRHAPSPAQWGFNDESREDSGPPAHSRVTSSVSASLPGWYSLSLTPRVAQCRPASTRFPANGGRISSFCLYWGQMILAPG